MPPHSPGPGTESTTASSAAPKVVPTTSPVLTTSALPSAAAGIATAGPDTGDPTDGRPKFEWKTRYTGGSAWRQICIEAAYTVLVALLSLVLIFLIWRGVFPKWAGFTPAEANTFRIYAYYTAAGLLGGTVFCLKYLYRVVARGYWHEDRRLWRYISPLISAVVAFAIGALIQSKLISLAVQSQTPGIVGTGFLVGYFGDQAVAKLHEIANVLFGTSTRSA